MRVEYTIPGFGPGANVAVTPATVETPTFKTRLRRLSAALPKSWRQLLRVNQPPAGATAIGPPAEPPALDIADAADHRLRWRNLLDRHAGVLENYAPAGDPDWNVQRMVALLLQYRQMEDSVVARHLSEPD